MSKNTKSLSWFPRQGAIDKVKEGDKLVAAGKITPQDKVTMAKRASTMSYSLQGSFHYSHHAREGRGGAALAFKTRPDP